MNYHKWSNELIGCELLKIASEIGYMPSKSDLLSKNLGPLNSAIQSAGGFLFWKNKLNLQAKPPRKLWNDDRFTEELLSVSKIFGKMPSNSDLRSINRLDLSNQIARRGGFLGVAKKFNLHRSHSDSDTGWDGERDLQDILIQKGFSAERITAVKSPFDLCINGCLRLDVKSTSYSEQGACRGWFYRVGKAPQADIVAFFQLDTKNVYFIPWNKCPWTNVTISRGGGKYKNYLNRYDYIEHLIKRRKDEDSFIL